ncbi:MAG: hypothetical protein HC904_03725 [Blastochloris sp.]|nr:hypothetical protein [Blastochloris sp.]
MVMPLWSWVSRCLAFWIKVEPFLGLYLLGFSALLYACLLFRPPGAAFAASPPVLGRSGLRQHPGPETPALALPLPAQLLALVAATLVLGFSLRYLLYEDQWQRREIQAQPFLEHLGYILFLPQLIQLLNLKPSEILRDSQAFPLTLWPAARILLIGMGKFTLFQLHLWLPLGIQEGSPPSFLHAWFQILSHALLWFLWLSAHYDLVIGIVRLFGLELRSNFFFPLLACSPAAFWRRWHVFHHHILRQYLYLPLGGRDRSWLASSACFLASALLLSNPWLCSASWLPPRSFFLQWLPFFMIHAVLLVLSKRLPLFSSQASSGQKIWGWLLTQLGFALSCLILVGTHRFPGDEPSLQTLGPLLKSAFIPF